MGYKISSCLKHHKILGVAAEEWDGMWEAAGGVVLGRAVWADLVPPLPLGSTAINFGGQPERNVFVSNLVNVLVTHDWKRTG